MEQEADQFTTLQNLLLLLQSWDGKSLNQAEEILQQAKELIALNTGVSVAENDTKVQQVTQQIVAAYGKLTTQLQQQKKAVMQQIQKMERPASTVSAYLQQDKSAALIDVDF